MRPIFHRYPGRQGNLDGQYYWTVVNGQRWEIESTGRGVWFAQRLTEEGYPLDTVVGWRRIQLEARMMTAASRVLTIHTHTRRT